MPDQVSDPSSIRIVAFLMWWLKSKLKSANTLTCTWTCILNLKMWDKRPSVLIVSTFSLVISSSVKILIATMFQGITRGMFCLMFCVTHHTSHFIYVTLLEHSHSFALPFGSQPQIWILVLCQRDRLAPLSCLHC